MAQMAQRSPMAPTRRGAVAGATDEALTPSPARPPKRSLQITPSDFAIVLAVYTYQFLTVEQVLRLLYKPGSLQYVRVRLKQLADAGFLHRLRQPRPTAGNTPFVYTLARRGINSLSAAGYAEFARFRPAEQQAHSWLFLDHTLAVNDVLIAAALVQRAVPDIVLADMRHERLLRHTPVRVTTDRGETIGIVPDGWLTFHLRGQAQMSIVLELDRGTVEQRPFQRKIRGLLAYAAGPYQQFFGTTSITVAIATTAGKERMERLRGWCEQVLRDVQREQEADLFFLTQLPEGTLDPQTLYLAPIWWQPFAQVPLPLLELS